jgi:hypothetical protein
MMFVSVLPTSAFAGGKEVDDPLHSATTYAKEIKDMIKDTKKDIERSYKFLTADQVVYGTVKAMDDTIVALVDGIGNTLIEKDQYTKADIDAVKDYVRAYFDGAVAKKMSENMYKAFDKDGVRDPLLYAQLVADSVSSALTNKDFQKGYEAVVTYWALASLVKDIRDDMKDQYKDFAQSIDQKFAKDFAEKYTTLVDDYIDTIGSAEAKALANSEAMEALALLMLPVDTAYDADKDAVNSQYKTDKAALDTARKDDIAAEEQTLSAAEIAYKQAQLAYDRVMNNKNATADDKKDAADAYKTAVDDYNTAKSDYKTNVKAIEKQYSDDLTALQNTRDDALYNLESQYLADQLNNEFLWEQDYDLEGVNPYGLLWVYPDVIVK